MFEKNLEHINNLALKRRLSKISQIESRVGISYCITPTNDYVLLKDDVPADDLENPKEAVKQMLNDNIKGEMKSNDSIVIFGLGLGYLLDETFNRFPSKIYLYEPDLNLLHFVLSNVDLSELLSSGRIFISNDLDELISTLSASYITKDRIEVVYLKNYGIIKNKELILLTQKIFEACKSKMVDVNTIIKFSKKWLINTIKNITYVNTEKGYLLSDLKNKYKGKTAIIAGAGPSLDENISKIKANRDKLTIFAVNKSVKYLLEKGITPDFVVCLDAYNMQKTLGELTPHLSITNAIADIRTDETITRLGFNKIFFNFSETDFFIKKLSKYNNFMRFFESGGTASSLALVSAIKMGFDKVILAGIDLAFKDNLIYTSGEQIQQISQTEMIVDNVKKNIVQVKSVNGTNVYTRDDYAVFIHHFATLIKELEFSEIYNVSSFGADIPGTKNVKFEDLNLQFNSNIISIESAVPFKFNLKEFIDEEFCAINNIISILSKRAFSPALVSAITKSILIYQYMQAEVLTVLQKNFDVELAQTFIEKTKDAIKTIVELLQRSKLI